MQLYLYGITNTFAQTSPAQPLPSASPSVLPLELKAQILWKQGPKTLQFASEIISLREAYNESTGEKILEGELSGRSTALSGSYLVNFKPMKWTADRKFVHKQKLTQETTDIRMGRILDNGKLEDTIYTIKVLNWSQVQSILKIKTIKPFSFLVGVGGTTMGYSQTNSDIGTLSSIIATFKLGTDYRFKDSAWQIGVLAFYNAIPLSGATGSSTFKFFGLNLRGGRGFPWLKAPWEIVIQGGWYYLTMLTNGTFGFNNITGPQLYPSLRYALPNDARIVTYLKFSPISQQFTLMSLTNYELAAGAQYQFPKRSKFTYSVSLDWTTLTLSTVDTIGLNTTARTNSITLGVNVLL